jgi:hypothetical protein
MQAPHESSAVTISSVQVEKSCTDFRLLAGFRRSASMARELARRSAHEGHPKHRSDGSVGCLKMQSVISCGAVGSVTRVRPPKQQQKSVWDVLSEVMMRSEPGCASCHPHECCYPPTHLVRSLNHRRMKRTPAAPSPLATARAPCCYCLLAGPICSCFPAQFLCKRALLTQCILSVFLAVVSM